MATLHSLSARFPPQASGTRKAGVPRAYSGPQNEATDLLPTPSTLLPHPCSFRNQNPTAPPPPSPLFAPLVRPNSDFKAAAQPEVQQLHRHARPHARSAALALRKQHVRRLAIPMRVPASMHVRQRGRHLLANRLASVTSSGGIAAHLGRFIGQNCSSVSFFSKHESDCR